MRVYDLPCPWCDTWHPLATGSATCPTCTLEVSVEECPECDGHGSYEVERRGRHYIDAIRRRDCPRCSGRGATAEQGEDRPTERRRYERRSSGLDHLRGSVEAVRAAQQAAGCSEEEEHRP